MPRDFSAIGNAPLTSANPPVLIKGKISEVTNSKRKGFSLKADNRHAPQIGAIYDTLHSSVLEEPSDEIFVTLAPTMPSDSRVARSGL